MISKSILLSIIFCYVNFSQNLHEINFASSSNNDYSVEEYFPFNTKSSYTFESNFGEIESFLELENSEVTAIYETSGIFYQQTYISKPEGIYVTATKMKFFFLVMT